MARKSIVLFSLALLLLASVMVTRGVAGQKIEVGADVAVQRRVGIDEIRHDAWNGLLAKYVDTAGLVDYRALKDSEPDVQALDGYLSLLSHADVSRPASRASTLAFWINAYNAVTVKGILREYPTTSIRNHTAKVVGYNIWDDLLLIVGGERYSLNDMEHKVLRKLGEPRIHFAIVCASIGCPRLLNEAYISDRLDEQLTTNARHFFADPAKFRIDQTGQVQVSPIMEWFAADFGDTLSDQLRTIAPLLPNDESKRIAADGTARVSYLDYDWGINDRAIETSRRGANR